MHNATGILNSGVFLQLRRWNLKITQLKRETHLPNLHDSGFQPLIRKGEWPSWKATPVETMETDFREAIKSSDRMVTPHEN